MPRPFFTLALSALVLVACTDTTNEGDHSTSISIRLSTSLGLEPISPNVRATFTRHILDLVLIPGDRIFTSVVPGDGVYLLHPRRPSSYSPSELAAALRHSRLETARAVGDAVEARLRPGPAPSLDDDFYLDIGPFEQESFVPGKLILRRRFPGPGVGRIEVTEATTEEEEWRRFLGRETDLVPLLSPASLQYLRQMPSVKLVQYQERPTMVLYFRLDSPIVGNISVRRAIANRLRRRAIASLAIGDANAAVGVDEVTDAHADVPRGPIRVVFYGGGRDHQQAALVLEQQLLELGMEVTVVPLSPQELNTTLSSGGFDLQVFFGGYEDRYLQQLASDAAGNIPKYRNSDFDKALNDGRMDDARALVIRDMPFTPLFTVTSAVAVDHKLCGVHPRANYDLSWLADIHRCASGELE